MKKELDFNKLQSEKPDERYSFAKELVIISEKEPEKVYPFFDEIVKMLNSDKKVILWSALKIFGNLAVADKDERIAPILPFLLAFLKSGNMITANNTINAIVKIAVADKGLLDDIVLALLKTKDYDYESLEQNNIIAGKAITALIRLFPKTKFQEEVKAFAANYIQSGRPETLARAEELLKDLEKHKN